MPTHLSRRKFLALTTAVAAHAATSHAAPTPTPSPNTQSLAGPWRIALDREDLGVQQSWFAQTLPTDSPQTETLNLITLPGILQTQGYGDDITATTPFVAALPRDMAWYKLPQYAAYTIPGHVEVPYLSQPIKHYLGVAWYQRDIEIPAEWSGKRVSLNLERTRWQTDLYLDSQLIGTNHSLVAPHQFSLGILTPGPHRLSIRIDNHMILPYRPDGHGVSDGEGSTWNGIVGDISLTATTPVWIDDAQVYPNVAARSVQIKVRIGNLTGQPGSGTLTAGGIATPITWTSGPTTDTTLTVTLPKATPWSEFTPTLQHLTLRLSGPQADDTKALTFGLREIRAEGKTLLLNNELLNLRMTHDGGGFPLTGYPATDLATWRSIISICKEWGLNGIRFHSWCPPEAAFTAADQLGFYLAPECGMWNSFDPDGKMLAILNDETARLLKAYGNHPSLILLNATNEPAGHYAEQLPTWDKKWRDADPRRLYSDGTGRFAPPPAGPGTPFAAGYLVTPAARGPRGWFGADYETTLQNLLHNTAIPAVGHEVGQWAAYPDFAVIDKFSGNRKYPAFPDGIGSGQTPYMVPGNYEIMRDSARASGLLDRNQALAHASGRFQLLCYKEEIEANLRTPSYSGYELLDLHDYLGQGGALIGLLDAFWEPKGYATPAEFRAFNNTTVPLARLKDRTYTTAQTLTADIELAHFGPAPLKSTTPRWSILDYLGNTVAHGDLPARAIPRGKKIPLGHISIPLAKLHAPAAYALVIELRGTSFKNFWPFWLYPTPEQLATQTTALSFRPEGQSPAVEKPATTPILVTTSWPEAEARLISGGKVLFLPQPADLDASDPKVSTVPIFWNHLMNPNGTTFLGLWCDATHPALAGFPTESNCDWQWVDLFSNTRALNLSTLPAALQPIIQPIDDWNRNLKLALLYECTVGYGQLMVCSLDLDQNRPGAPTLRRSILDYMASPAFHPTVAIALDDLRTHWLTQNPHPAPTIPTQPNQPTSPDLVDPGQIRRPPN